MEYTKQATDMVLDYLEQNREQPDQELLKKLQWDAEDLKAFQERWQQTRRLPAEADAESQQELDEALRSLGLQKENRGALKQRDQSDGLQGIEDSGNRLQPPPIYRDLFESFRWATKQTR